MAPSHAKTRNQDYDPRKFDRKYQLVTKHVKIIDTVKTRDKSIVQARRSKLIKSSAVPCLHPTKMERRFTRRLACVLRSAHRDIHTGWKSLRSKAAPSRLFLLVFRRCMSWAQTAARVPAPPATWAHSEANCELIVCSGHDAPLREPWPVKSMSGVLL